MNRPSVSVCMATYNGINYIEEQINSILPQLNKCDKLLISDDGSKDGTFEYIMNLSENDKRIKVFKGPRQGPTPNFFYLFTKASNDIIFISDQDDIWNKNKINLVCKAFISNPHTLVVLHKDIVKYTTTRTIEKCVPYYKGVTLNLLRNSYSGHRTAFRRDFTKYFLLDTMKCPAYDQYIGLLAEKHKCGVFLNKSLDIHLVHDSNVSHKRSIYEKIKIRYKLLNCLLLSN